jgi:hypothetical protein
LVPALHVQGLEKSHKKLRVLRGVDFDVARGSAGWTRPGMPGRSATAAESSFHS